MRRKFLAGNLKMNGCLSSICELVDAITTRSKNFHDCDVVILPPYLYLNEVSLLLEKSHLSLGSQNICQFNNGSYTGEISAQMISELGCDYVLIGHSERRNFFLETNNHILEKVKRAKIPYIVILISGRPMIINKELDSSHAFVAAWLPGTEGEGISDVLFGDFNFTGKLSMTWPRSMKQIPINYGDSSYDPLFKFGFGLSYD